MQIENQLDDKARQKLEGLVSSSKVVLFMKGTKSAPQCGFSDAVVKTLNALGVDYLTYDVLTDLDIRQGMKVYSEWATFPQLYINKEFVGGCDIVMEMYQSGELQKLLK